MFNEIWAIAKDGDKSCLALYEAHYSCYKYKDGRKRKKFVGPGEHLILVTPETDALFVWRKFKDSSGQKGINCSVFRNESDYLSSDMIKEAVSIALKKWPHAKRFYTYVNPQKIKSRNPGCCFSKAGWKKCGITKVRKLLIFEFIIPLRNAKNVRGRNRR